MNLLSNDTIRLRAPEPSDLDLLYIWENDTELWNNGCTITPFSRQILEKYLQTAHLELYETQQLRLMIELIKGNRAIGTIDLFEYEPFHQRAGVGILLADKNDRKKGYASAALKLTSDYAFQFLGLKQLFCHINVSNEESLKLFRSAGFEVVGTKKAWTRRGMKWLDEIFLQKINL